MGLSGNMRSWRWWSGAGAFRTGVGVVLLGLCLAQPVSSQTTCSAAATPQNFSQPKYQNTATDSSAGFMAALVHSFLHTVQPKPFPEDLIQQIVKIRSPDSTIINNVLLYEIGFLVCAAIGVVYIVLMPIVGFFLACCRCCGNCGGDMYQKQTSSIHCRRRTLYWSAFITTAIILAGNICMFKSNQDLTVTVDQSPAQLNNTIDNIYTFLTAVPQQINYVVNESNRTIQVVTSNLQDIGSDLGAVIQEQIRGPLHSVRDSVFLLDRETANISVMINALNSSLVQLQSSMTLLQSNITNVRNNINQTLSNPNCTSCESQKSELQKLTLDMSINIPSLNDLQSAVDAIVNINLTSKYKLVENFNNSIPQTVTNNTMDVVKSSEQQLSAIATQISQVTSDIPLSALTDVSKSLAQLQSQIAALTPQIQNAGYIRWSVCLAICCAVLLVVVCNVLGLILGPLGLIPRADPTKRSCTANCGGIFLMMAAGFSFVFSWLLMILVLLLFLLGGNMYTLVCQPWSNGQLLAFIDSSGLILNLTVGQTNLSVSEIYKKCEGNRPVWDVLHLYQLINLDDLLNVSKYTGQIQQQFENMNMNLPSITLLTPQVINQLSNFSTKANSFDPSSVTQKMNNISSINLNTTALILYNLSLATANNDIKNQLQNEAGDLRLLQTYIETTIIPQFKNLNSSIKGLQSTTGKISRTVGEVLNNVGTAQNFLDTNTTQIVKTASINFLDCQLGYFTAYADWAKLMITQQVGRCQPVAGALDVAETIICSQVVESLNAFWFCLGWCIIFFIPSIIFSIKLAKYYRRMKSSDVFENHIIMTHIPRAQMKVT